jgi:hypothetical protein
VGVEPRNRCPADLANQDGYVVGVLGDGFTVAIEGDRLTVTAMGNGFGRPAFREGTFRW